MNQENGSEQGARNIGRFFLALIPWALGLGAAVWFGLYLGVHQFRHELSQEERAAIYVGASVRPTAKVQIVVVPHDCSRIVRADLDGTILMLYGVNDCYAPLNYFSWHWQLLSPDGVAIQTNYTNQCPIPTLRGDKAECKMDGDYYHIDDERGAVLRVWSQIEPR